MNKSWIWIAAVVVGVAMMAHAADLRMEKFLNEMHHTHQMEVGMGKMAESKGHSDVVKEYGKTLAKDHQAADEKLRRLATEKNLRLKTSRHKDKTLKKLSGATFDQEFVKAMIMGHKKEIARLEDARQWLPEGNVRDYVSDVLPHLQAHLATAERINSATPK